ncbi:hypothetical protein RIF29_22758 [Crotalaria pallida]|uniref:Phytosulfokine n=1 Tax=Crotalaria pallida TaxID=3830 RepID=A0AAN9F5D4_CROPI
MSYKVNANLCMAIFFFFLFLTFTFAARPSPAHSPSSPLISSKLQQGVLEDEKVDVVESCEGVKEEEDCLMRRTLVAHTDYIYTDNHKP